MNSLLFGITLSALLSTTSLLIVLFRVSPLTAPEQAVPAFFASVFLSASTLTALAFYGIWSAIPSHILHWDTGKLLSISVRQGFFIGFATMILLGFHLLGLLTWWIAILIYFVFVLIELAMNH